MSRRELWIIEENQVLRRTLYYLALTELHLRQSPFRVKVLHWSKLHRWNDETAMAVSRSASTHPMTMMLKPTENAPRAP